MLPVSNGGPMATARPQPEHGGTPDGPLQEQPSRPRVQPVRGLQPPGDPGQRPLLRGRRGHRPRDPARGRAPCRERARREPDGLRPQPAGVRSGGELGERNGAYVTNVEHKMGLKVSTTCEVTFGQKQPAVSTLLGDTHDGIAQMFRIIEFARMMVGTKAIATLSTGYLNALEYAKQRVQGTDLTQMTNKIADRVSITHHPDVRRSLMLQKAY